MGRTAGSYGTGPLREVSHSRTLPSMEGVVSSSGSPNEKDEATMPEPDSTQQQATAATSAPRK